MLACLAFRFSLSLIEQYVEKDVHLTFCSFVTALCQVDVKKKKKKSYKFFT